MQVRGFRLAAWVAALAALAAGVSAATLGSRAIAVDGHRYGGNLVVGADKNLEALRVLIKAADAMGQLRNNQYGGSQYLVIGDTTNAMRITGSGTWNGQPVKAVIDWDYRVPGIRTDLTGADGKTRTVTVAAATLAWDEKMPGVFGGQAANSAPERLVVAYLMPPAVILTGRDAADVLKVVKEGASTRMTVPVPKLGANVSLVSTLDAHNRPVKTSIALNGKTYTGEFDDFSIDRMDMGVKFAHKVVLKVDGKEFANLDIEWHQANPYLIFPVPKEVVGK